MKLVKNYSSFKDYGGLILILQMKFLMLPTSYLNLKSIPNNWNKVYKKLGLGIHGQEDVDGIYDLIEYWKE